MLWPHDIDSFGPAITMHGPTTWMNGVAKTSAFIPNRLHPWIEARQRFRLSHAQVQMARELRLNPQKFGKLDNHHQKPWKQPLPEFIATLYEKRFGRSSPVEVRSIEQIAAAQRQKKQERKARQGAAGEAAAGEAEAPASLVRQD